MTADILLVDDTPENLRVLVGILTEHSYHVRAATSGKRALDSIAKARPDLILLDLRMPGMDGFEVCRRLKLDPETQAIPVIFVSAADDIQDKVQAFQAGAADYVTKPFQAVEVLARIESQLTITRQRKHLIESHNLLSSVLNCSLDGVTAHRAVRDEAGTIRDFQWTLANPAAATFLRRKAEDLIGQSLFDLLPALRGTGLFEDYVRVVETGESLEREIHTESAQRGGVWVHIVAVRLGDGLSVTFRDITERKQMELALSRMANRDGLTDLPNRRSFDDTLSREWKRCARAQQPLAVIMADVDSFKAYNDSLGHLQGDSCLVQVARALERAVKRPGDLAARYGGEEFAVILSETGLEGARTVAEAIAEEVSRLALPHGAAPAGRVTLSMGLAATVPQVDGDGPMSLVAAADRSLYRAKQGGRNQIHSEMGQEQPVS